MPRDKKDITRFTFRLPRGIDQDLSKRAAFENLSKSELCLNYIRNELYKDVNIENAQLGALQELLTLSHKLEKKLDVFSNIFIYYLKYFFATHAKELDKDIVGNINELMEKGEINKDIFIKNFKTKNNHMTSLIESLLADFIAQDKDNE